MIKQNGLGDQNEDDCGRGIGHCDRSSGFVDLAAPAHHTRYGQRVFEASDLTPRS